MQETTNYKLKKIELPDAPPDITVLNPNWDTIDEELKALADKPEPSYMTGATSTVAGKAGLVPAPAAGEQNKVLKGDGTWGDIFDLIYPVGSIYMSTAATSPAVLFGGIWEAMPAGRVLVSAGTASTGTVYTIGTKGGEEKHKQTLEELVAHNHTATSDLQGNHIHSGTTDTQGAHNHTTTFGVNDGTGNNPNGSIYSTNGNYTIHPTTNAAGNHSHSLNINAAGIHSHNIIIANNGGGKAFNIMQPYEVVYRWKRIA